MKQTLIDEWVRMVPPSTSFESSSLFTADLTPSITEGGLLSGGSGRGTTHSRGLPRLTFDDAFVYAERTVRAMTPGTTFTSQELFSGMAFRFDSRRLSGILCPLRVSGLIMALGATQEGQEGRHNGWATKWVRTGGGWEL